MFVSPPCHHHYLHRNEGHRFFFLQVGGGTVLARALKMNLRDVADVLLRHGVDINARDKVRTPSFLFFPYVLVY